MCWLIQIESTNETNTSFTSGLWSCINHVKFMKIIKPQPRHKEGVLVLAGVELIFFAVAGMGLCFGFVLKTVLVIQGCFSYC